MMTNPVEMVDVTEDGKGGAEDLPGYVRTGEYRQIRDFNGDWVHSNNGSHLSGGISYGEYCQMRWKTLAVMPARSYDTPSGRVGRSFVYALATELTGFRKRRLNADRFIVFQKVIIERA